MKFENSKLLFKHQLIIKVFVRSCTTIPNVVQTLPKLMGNELNWRNKMICPASCIWTCYHKHLYVIYISRLQWKIKYLPTWPIFCERKINQRLINGNKFNPNKKFMTSEWLCAIFRQGEIITNENCACLQNSLFTFYC